MKPRPNMIYRGGLLSSGSGLKKVGFHIHCAQPYDEMHHGHWLNIKFGFPQTGKGSLKIFEFGWQTAWEINF